MITDLVEIRRLGEKKRGENEKLRQHMKRHEFVERRLRRIAEDIEDEIDCTVCANCCRHATVKLQERDVDPLARHLRLSRSKFLAQYAEQSEEEGLILKRTPEHGCVFLDGNLCSVYEARPATCVGFPHLVRGAGSLQSRMWQMVDRACYCPIVYNALEAFKVEVRFFEKSGAKR
ncbi:MAG: YkgJ family cysteine cluster protein [Acidimicrobiia bacterium]|nr:YkgJ family cysteine cluster protein [Acidimicrobiia bacterium]